MARTMKRLLSIVIIIFAISIVGLITNRFRSQETEKTEDKPIVRTYLTGKNDLELSTLEVTTLGTNDYAEIVIIGSDENATLTATGSGYGTICAAMGVTLAFENLTIEDETPDDRGSWNDYLSFGGKLRFENCEFISPLYLTYGARATFKDCVFRMGLSDVYAVWVGDGSVSFENCRFTGQRAIYVNEFEDGDVLRVNVDGCTFLGLNVKPGVVVGDIHADPANTTVIIRRSFFEWCASWNEKSAIEGIDGIFETSTATAHFNFKQYDNNAERSDEGWTPFY